MSGETVISTPADSTFYVLSQSIVWSVPKTTKKTDHQRIRRDKSFPQILPLEAVKSFR